MADYNQIKDYKQLYHKLWSEMYDKVCEMQEILTKADNISRLMQYESKDCDFKIHTINMASLFGAENKDK